MKDNLIGLLLAPILIPQGIYTRLVTPKLPEPEGERFGENGSGKPLKLLVLGDSAAAGVGVHMQSEALTGNLVSNLSADFLLEWKLEAKTGRTTSDTIKALLDIEAFETEIVVVSLGVNDVTSLISLGKWLLLQSQLQELLIAKFKAKHILLSGIPPMDRFPALPQPLRWFLGRRSRTFNSALHKQSLGTPKVEHKIITFPVTENFIAKDGFHPSNLAYAFWSDIAAKLILEIFRNSSQKPK